MDPIIHRLTHANSQEGNNASGISIVKLQTRKLKHLHIQSDAPFFFLAKDSNHARRHICIWEYFKIRRITVVIECFS